MRTWSWKYSRCRRPAQRAARVRRAATARSAPRAAARARSHSARASRKPVMPPQRVASACSTSTAPASSMRRKYDGVVAVLARRDLHAGRRAVAQQPQPLEIVATTPAPRTRSRPRSAKRSRHAQRLLARVGAVGVDEQLALPADGLARRAHALDVARRLAADLHLHRADALRRPSRRAARASSRSRVRGEAAAAVDRHARARTMPSSVASGTSEQPRLQVPQRGVDRGDRHRRDARPPEVADAPAPSRPARAAIVERVAAHARTSRELSWMSRAVGDVRVGVAEPVAAAGRELAPPPAWSAFHSSVPSDSGRRRSERRRRPTRDARRIGGVDASLSVPLREGRCATARP